MEISVIVGATRASTIPTTIDSVLRQTHTDWEMFVVTQGARSDAFAVVQQYAARDPRIRSCHIDESGLSRARNAGVGRAAGAVLAFTDDDCEADPTWLAEIDRYFEEHPDVDLLGGGTVAPPRPHLRVSACPSFVPTEVVYEPPGSTPKGWGWLGCNFGVRRSVFDRIGLFDQYLGAGSTLPAGEDTDFKLRLETAGIRMGCSPRPNVLHRYGRRNGVREVLRLSRNYAIGNGGLTAKLKLMGDPRGDEWFQITKDQCAATWRTRPTRTLFSPGRWRNFCHGYDLCLRNFEVEDDLLRRRH